MTHVPDELLTPAEVARIFRVSASSVTRWVREGHVPAIRLPGERGQIRIRRTDVELFLNPTPAAPAAEAAS